VEPPEKGRRMLEHISDTPSLQLCDKREGAGKKKPNETSESQEGEK
jgi:hypothetical protein